MISVPVRLRRAEGARFFQKIQHAAPSIVLLTDGVARLRDTPRGESLALGSAEIVVSVVVIGSLARAMRRARAERRSPDHAPHARAVDWIDIALGAMLIVEAIMHRQETGHVPRPTILLAATMIVLGLFHGRLIAFGDRRRSLRVTDDGISVPLRVFSRLTLSWDDLAELDVEGDVARIVAHDGRQRRLAFAEIAEPAKVREALLVAKMRFDAHQRQ